MPIPSLTDERRKELSRHVHKQAEEGRNVVRQVRRDANERLKKLLKEHKISEDDERKGLEQVQKITDEHVKLIDELQKKKDAGAARRQLGRLRSTPRQTSVLHVGSQSVETLRRSARQSPNETPSARAVSSRS